MSTNEAINEEYKIWKKNVPFLYSTMLTHALEWPSLTVQFLPERTLYPDQQCTKQKLVLGTHTSQGEQNYLITAELRLPSEDATVDATQYDQQKQQVGGFSTQQNYSKIEVVQRINHDGEVNKARYCPQKPNIIATKTSSGMIYLFDYTKYDNTPQPDGACVPMLKLRGQKEEGWGLSWSSKRMGRIASASEDRTVCIWDVESTLVSPAPLSSGKRAAMNVPEMDPVLVLGDHGGVVEDVSWHHHHENIIGSVCDDRYLRIWDARTQDSTAQRTPIHKIAAHKSMVNSIDFAPYHEYLLLTGGSDKVVKLWDMRNLKQELHTLESHTEEVFSVQWSPFNETVLASSGGDRRVMVWDISRIGMEQSAEDAEDGPAELLFIHGGHTSRVSDFAWNPNPQEEWVIASVAEDNILQAWQMAENIHTEDGEAVDRMDLE